MSDAPAPVREPLHSRVAGLLEHAFNPIMLKELRASLRGLRFFISHIVILCIFATGLLMAFLAMTPSRGYNDPGDPSEVGRSVYLITQFLQLGVAFLVVPGLAATSISSERESLTHDLLLTTTMTARQIVWGKFTAAMTQAFTIFVSMLPLVSLCFLFGGVTVYQILANYAFLFALSTVMIAYALSMSASARTTQRAVGSVYGLTLLGGLLLWGLAAALLRTPWLGSIAVSYGFIAPVDAGRWGSPLDLADRVLYVHLVPAYVWVAATTLFFINATNRLKPLFANRSTPLRVYFMTVLFTAGAIAALLLYHSLPPTSPTDDRSYSMMAFAIITLAASLLGALFACEEPFPSPMLGNRPPAGSAWSRALGLFRPGSNSGAAFTVIVVSLFLLCAYAAFLPFTRGFDRGAWSGLPASLPLAAALMMVACWTVFTGTFARFLAALLPERPMLLRTILVLSCLFLALFPLIHWAIAEAIDRDPLDVERRHGPVTLALSPVMAILSSLDLRAGRREFPLYAGTARIPVAAGFAFFSLAAGALFLKLGNRARAKLQKEMEAEPGTKVSERAPA